MIAQCGVAGISITIHFPDTSGVVYQLTLRDRLIGAVIPVQTDTSQGLILCAEKRAQPLVYAKCRD